MGLQGIQRIRIPAIDIAAYSDKKYEMFYFTIV